MTVTGQKLAALRARYADEICASAGVEHERVREAFATVAREAFLTPPPWRIFSPGGVLEQLTEEPEDLYQDVLVVLDPGQGINNGQPSLHAAWLAAADPQEGEKAIHVGAGAGYYTAILARLVGPAGMVHAYEIDERLADIARQNLAALSGVTVHRRSGAGGELPQADVVYVNAGAFAPDPSWLRALVPRGRLIFPWQPSGNGAGYALLLTRRARGGFSVRDLMMVGFIPLVDERKPPSRSTRDCRATRSAWLASERAPDATATAIWPDVWFSSDEVG